MSNKKKKDKTNIIDVPRIIKNIREHHRSFLDKYGALSDKAIADNMVRLEYVWNKILLVSKCFSDEGIIGKFEDVSTESSYCVLKIYGNNPLSHIYILTNGSLIVFKDAGFYIDGKLQTPFVEVLYDVNDTNYDWVAFADKLLYYIHETIYSRRQAVEISIFGNNQD